MLARNRIEELKKLIETAARWNNRNLPSDYEKTLLTPCEKESHGSILDLFKPEYLRTTLLLLVAWYTLVLQYMAITLHIGEMGGNIFLITVSFKISFCRFKWSSTDAKILFLLFEFQTIDFNRFSYSFQICAGIFESIAVSISIFTVKYGIQKNIFYSILVAGICLILALYPNLDWMIVIFLAMLGKHLFQYLHANCEVNFLYDFSF